MSYFENEIKLICEQTKIDGSAVGVFFTSNNLFLSSDVNNFKLLDSETLEELKLILMDIHVDSSLHVISCGTELADIPVLSCDIPIAKLEHFEKWRSYANPVLFSQLTKE